MISFVVLVCLLALSADAKRSDHVGSITPEVNTHWGDWGPDEWCPDGEYVNGFSLKSESYQGPYLNGGDDTALNGIRLYCRELPGLDTHDISSTIQKWGNWKAPMYCPKGQFIRRVSLRSERSLGGGNNDDTAANNLFAVCETPSGTVISTLRGEANNWGTWGEEKNCPVGSFVCGIRTRVEAPATDQDDTALNEATFHCCKHNAQ